MRANPSPRTAECHSIRPTARERSIGRRCPSTEFASFDSVCAFTNSEKEIRGGRARILRCQQWGVPTRLSEAPSILPPPRLLAAARVLVGLSQRELAAEAGLAVSSVGRYEAGLSTMRADSLGSILAVLRKRGVRFLEETGEVAMGILLLKEAPGIAQPEAVPDSKPRTRKRR